MKALFSKETRKKAARAWQFAVDDVWDVELASLSSLHRLGVNAIRVVQLVFRGYREDECPLHASALTFSTLMSIVPVLALSLALARGLGGAEAAKHWVLKGVNEWTQGFQSHSAEAAPAGGDAADASPAAAGTTGAVDTAAAPVVDTNLVTVAMAAPGMTNVVPVAEGPDAMELAEQINHMVESGFEKVEQISFKGLGGVGLAILLWMAISVLGRVEASFNRVWGVAVGRSLWRKFTDYLSVLFVLPLLFVAATSLPVASFATRFLDDRSAAFVTAILGSGFLKNVTVLLMTALTFSFLLMFMPNTKVKALPGFAGGLVTAILFLLWLWACAAMQVGAARTGKIYGSFAVVPIVLAWVHVSWQIVFFGAEVAFACQNCATYRMEQGARRANMRARLLLALSVVMEAARNMLGDGRALDVLEFARKRCIPVRFLNEVVDELTHGGFLGELSEQSGGHVLLRSPSAITAGEVMTTVMQSGVEPEDLGLSSLSPIIEETVAESSASTREALDKMTIETLVERAGEAEPQVKPSGEAPPAAS